VPPQQPQSSGPSKDAVIALVLSFLTMMTGCFPLGFFGLHYGRKARRQALVSGNKTDEVLGLVAMIVGGVLGACYALLWVGIALMYLIPLLWLVATGQMQ